MLLVFVAFLFKVSVNSVAEDSDAVQIFQQLRASNYNWFIVVHKRQASLHQRRGTRCEMYLYSATKHNLIRLYHNVLCVFFKFQQITYEKRTLRAFLFTVTYCHCYCYYLCIERTVK